MFQGILFILVITVICLSFALKKHRKKSKILDLLYRSPLFYRNLICDFRPFEVKTERLTAKHLELSGTSHISFRTLSEHSYVQFTVMKKYFLLYSDGSLIEIEPSSFFKPRRQELFQQEKIGLSIGQTLGSISELDRIKIINIVFMDYSNWRVEPCYTSITLFEMPKIDELNKWILEGSYASEQIA